MKFTRERPFAISSVCVMYQHRDSASLTNIMRGHVIVGWETGVAIGNQISGWGSNEELTSAEAICKNLLAMQVIHSKRECGP